MDGDQVIEGLDSGQQQQGTGGGHPAWGELLGEIPQELHSKVTPHLQNFDRNVETRFQKVHAEYEPWKGIIKNSDPETTQFALQMLNALESDPKTVYRAIGDFYKDQLGDLVQPSHAQGQGGPPNQDLEDKPWMADVTRLRQENELLAQVLTTQRQEAEAAAADAALDKELKSLSAKYGEYDEKYVLGLIMANPDLNLEDAVKTWQESVKTYAEKMGFAGPKPFFMGSGSGIPGQNVNLKTASDKDTKDVVVQMLQAAAQQNRQ